MDTQSERLVGRSVQNLVEIGLAVICISWSVIVLGQNFLPGPRQFFVAWIRSCQPSFIWVGVWKIYPKKPKIFQFFLSRSKKSHRVVSKSTCVKDGFTAGQSLLGSGQGPSPNKKNILFSQINFVKNLILFSTKKVF